jgi:transcriptional regulator with XRE-family HTH domain
MAQGEHHTIAPQDSLRAILLERRLKLGLSQDQLAFLSGYERTSIIKIEKGTRFPTLGTLLNLCSVLGIRPSTVMARLEKEIGFELLPKERIKQTLETEKQRSRLKKKFGKK